MASAVLLLASGLVGCSRLGFDHHDLGSRDALLDEGVGREGVLKDRGGDTRADAGSDRGADAGSDRGADVTTIDLPSSPDVCGITEICNGKDDNCDGRMDEGACSPGCVGRTRGSTAYMFCNVTRRWDQALADCAARGMTLAIVRDAAMDAWIFATAQALGYAPRVWIGGTDGASEGQWRWSDGSPFGYDHWGFGQPDNTTGDEDCVAIIMLPTGSFLAGDWNDDQCFNSHRYVCEL